MTVSSLFTDPLFSTIITVYLLVLLYFPTIIFSPVLISTSILLLSLLRFGATQKKNQINYPVSVDKNIDISNDDCKRVPCEKPDPESGSWDNHYAGPFYSNASFVEWDVRAPLDVIYEGYEGQGEDSDGGGDDDVVFEEKRDLQMAILERYASLSKYYPESDSDASEEEDFPAMRGWDQPENTSFRWDGEDKDGMIEIALEGKRYSDFEEDNLIEIDLYPASLPVR